jgi:ACDE family multidrug resistance protein
MAGDSPAGRAALAVLLAGSTLTVMAGAIVAPVLKLIRRDLALSPTGTGLVLTVHGLSLALASPLIGRAIDRWGVRRVLTAGLVAYGATGGAGIVTNGFAELIVSRLAFGIGAAAVFTGTTVALLGLFGGRERDRAMGWRASAISLGGVASPLLGGALGAASWHAPFAVYLVGIPLGLIAAAVLPRPERARQPDRARPGELMSASATFGGQLAAPLVLGPVVGATSISAGFLAAAATAGGVALVLGRK